MYEVYEIYTDQSSASKNESESDNEEAELQSNLPRSLILAGKQSLINWSKRWRPTAPYSVRSFKEKSNIN